MYWLILIILSIPSLAMGEEYWFSPYTGTGTDASPFIAHGTAQGAKCIDIRDDYTQNSIGGALCHGAVLPAAPGVISLGKTATATLSGKMQSDLSTATGKTITATSTMDLLKTLLVDSGKLKAGPDGKIEIFFGDPAPVYKKTAWVPFEDHGVVADIWNKQKDAALVVAQVIDVLLWPPVALATTLSTETFTASDGDLAGCSCVLGWAEDVGTQWAIASNQAKATFNSATRAEARSTNTLATDNMEVSLTLVSQTVGGTEFNRCGPIARKSAAASTYVGFMADAVTSGPEHTLMKRVAGTLTVLLTDATDPANGQTMKIRTSTGDAISGFRNGSLLLGPTTDAAGSGNTNIGIANSVNTSSTATCTVDTLDAADYSATTRRPHAPIFLQ